MTTRTRPSLRKIKKPAKKVLRNRVFAKNPVSGPAKLSHRGNPT
jgi:hypothetical protein